MDLKFRKTVLLMGACVALGGAYSSNAYAASPNQPVQTVQQSKKVTGTVVDAEGPVIGASVVEKGNPSNGAITDLDGNFEVNVPQGATLVISYIGYKTQEIKVGNQSRIDVTLSADETSLEDVVVVGYGVQKKKLVTGATVQVKGDDIARMNTTNALTAMQATTPGVQISQSSTQPGKGFKVNIRGVGTIGDSSPLLVIDGVPSGTADDGLNGINPNDIETIDVLKDAASAAIYGSRAANGVILVTTKQGKAGKVTISYDGYIGWSNAYKRPATLNAQQYMQVINEANFNTYGTATDWSSLVPSDILEAVNNGWTGTDWFEEYRNKNAVQTSHAVTLTGGTDRSRFSMSLNYSHNDGIMGGDVASNYKRYGGRINSEHVLLKGKDHDIITIGENVSYWYHKTHALAEGNGYWNSVHDVYVASPLVRAWNEDGTMTNYNDNHTGYSPMIFTQPMAALYAGSYNATQRDRDFGVGATFYFVVEPIKNLKWRSQFNTGYSASNGWSYTTPYSSSSTSANTNYGVSQSDNQSSSLELENTLSYILPEIAKNHFDVMVGQSIEQSNWSVSLSNSAQTSANEANSLVLSGPYYQMVSNYGFANVNGATGTLSPKKGQLASFFGRVNWNYDEKYMATAILRADGSNKFAKGHRWSWFPSFSAGWVVTQEKFMENTRSWLNYFKIRGSWGQNGNQSINEFLYLSQIRFSPSDYADYGYKFSSDNAYTVGGPANYTTGAYAYNQPTTDLKWETSEQLDFGFDAYFLNNRLGVNFDWYRKTTKDWLVPAALLDVTGYEDAGVVNGGDVRNTGIELALSWNDNIGKDFRYHANVNLATNSNKVTKLKNGTLGSNVSSALFQNSSYVSLVDVGHAIGYFSGMSYSGIWQNQAQIDAARAAGQAVLDGAKPGDMIWDDWNGDGVITLDGDRHDIGDPHPNVTLGVVLGCEWKGFDFSIQGSGAFGQQIMQYYRTAQLANPYQNYTQDIFERWHGEGTSNTQPRLTVGGENNSWVSTRYMQDADYFKIQNITLGYDFCKLWKNSPFQQIRLYVQAQNILTITGYTGVDPETSSTGGVTQKDGGSWATGIDLGLYPPSRTYLVGCSIKF